MHRSERMVAVVVWEQRRNFLVMRIPGWGGTVLPASGL